MPKLLGVLFISMQAIAQPVDTAWTTGYQGNTVNSAPVFDRSSFTDSNIAINYGVLKENYGVPRIDFFSKTSLQKTGSTELPLDSSVVNGFGFGTLSFNNNNERFYSFFRSLNSGNKNTISLFKLGSGYTIRDTIYTVDIDKKWGHPQIKLLGNQLFVVAADQSSGQGGGSDTILIRVYNHRGSIINEKKHYPTNSSQASGAITAPKNVINLVLGIFQHPNNPDAFILPYSLFNQNLFQVISKTSLDTLKSYPIPYPLLFKNNYFSVFFTNFHADSDGFTVTGYTDKAHFVNGQYIPSDMQGLVYRANWQGDSLELRNFGNPFANERSYAYSSSIVHNQQYLSTSTPWDDFRVNGKENRQVVIYRWNKFGTDSIVLYGNQNHVASDIHADDNGDLFIVGTYNNWNGLDSNNVWLSKIPSFAIGLIEEGKIQAKLNLHPNPAINSISISNWPDQWPLEVDYQIFGLGGHKVLHGKIRSQQALSVLPLPPGNYILQLYYQGEQHNVLWVKK